MGAWGWGVFSNDLAADVRSAWREAILDGEDPAQASARIIERSGAPHDLAREVTAEVTQFWTGLAAAQMETGRLQPDVRDRALAVIAAGGDLNIWEESGAGRQRERVLERLASRLRGPQPAAKRLRGSRPAPDPGVRVGDVVRIWNRGRSRSALFAVTALRETGRGRWPALLGLYWDGGEIPDADKLAALPYLSAVDLGAFDGDEPPDHMGVAFPHAVTVVVSRPGDELRPEVGEVVAHGVARREDWGPYTMTGWEGVSALVEDGGGFDVFLAVTRRRLSRYGDDPRASAREQEDLFSEPPAFWLEHFHRLQLGRSDQDEED
jgi:hypothetical protein